MAGHGTPRGGFTSGFERLRASAGGRQGSARHDGPPKGTRRSGIERERSSAPVRKIIVALIIAAAVCLVVVLGFLVLSYTPAFTIEGVDAASTTHVSADDIKKLADIPKGSTLLNLDEDHVVQSLRKDPWIADVNIVREFPNRIRIEVSENTVAYVVVMSTGDVAWCLGADNVWIEPLVLEVSENESIATAALAQAKKLGATLVYEVPASVRPQAGSTVTDETIQAVESYMEQLSSGITSQIVSFSAASLESISCTLKSGVEVSLGSPTSISSKDSVLQQILSKYAGKLTYVSVRTPSNPSIRLVDSDSVQAGTGAFGKTVTDVSDRATSDVSDSDASMSSSSSDSSAAGNAALQTSANSQASQGGAASSAAKQ